jgi:hypothetical protein
MRSGAIVGAATQSNDRAADAATTRRPYPAAAILARKTVSATKVSEFLKFIGKKIIYRKCSEIAPWRYFFQLSFLEKIV